MRALPLLCLAAQLQQAAAGPPAPAPLECGMRKLALARAKTMQPWRDHAKTFDALELATLCGLPPPPPTAGSLATPAAPAPLATGRRAIRVDAAAGSDAGAGTSDAPFRSVQRALAAARATRAAAGAADSAAPPPPIVLNSGVYFLNATLEFGPADSGQVITAADGAEAWLSGGKELKPASLQWKPASGFKDGAPVIVASLAGLGVLDVHATVLVI